MQTGRIIIGLRDVNKIDELDYDVVSIDKQIIILKVEDGTEDEVCAKLRSSTNVLFAEPIRRRIRRAR